ncbi:MAG TPA: hypothetical protein DHW02_20335 [Ktedonobacter sp.]|nr:hypothetical protein [Ktedonobacter sp.]
MSNISSYLPLITNKLRPKVLFFGMQSTFSTPSLLTLLEQGIEVCGVVLPASPMPGHETPPIQRRKQPEGRRIPLPLLTMSTQQSIVEIAWREQIPVWDVYRLSHKETYDVLVSYQPDIICVACFSQRIPRSILDVPRSGCLNVHPSLLPANRGPDPLFWTFREGQETTGVTIHAMSEGMDTGDILAQESIAVSDGISYEQLESQCAQLGGKLLAETVWNVYTGSAIATPQNEAKSYAHSFPTDEDLIVHAEEWDARRVYNFIRGTGHLYGLVTVYDHEKLYLVKNAISYSRNGRAIELYNDRDEQGIEVRCKTGYVILTLL